MRWLLPLALILISSSAPADDLDPAVFNAQVARLSKLLRSKVTALDRDMVTFHYEHDPAFNPTSVQQIVDRFLSARSFFVPDINDDNNQGPGIYVSVDPVGSRSFGGWDAPQLYVFTIKAKARLLDTTHSMTAAEIAELQDTARQLGCPPTAQKKLGSFQEATAYFRDGNNKTCARAIVNSFIGLGIQGVLYDYSASSTFKGCRERDEAINVISPEIIDHANIGFFSKSAQVFPEPLGGLVKALYSEGERDFGLRMMSDNLPAYTLPTPGLGDTSVTRDQYLRWRNRYIYKCGPIWSTERNLRNKQDERFNQIINGIFDKTYTDVDVQNQLIATKQAYFKKFADWNTKEGRYTGFEAMRVNLLEQMSYKASGFADDMSKLNQWQRAVDIYDASDLENAKKAAALLEEKTDLLPIDDTQSHYYIQHLTPFLKSTSPKQPDLIWRLLKLAGYGERLRAIAANAILTLQYGMTPALTKKAFHDPAQHDRVATQRNRDLFLRVLRGCAVMYDDPTKTPEEIQKGPCGVRASTGTN